MTFRSEKSCCSNRSLFSMTFRVYFFDQSGRMVKQTFKRIHGQGIDPSPSHYWACTFLQLYQLWSRANNASLRTHPTFSFDCATSPHLCTDTSSCQWWCSAGSSACIFHTQVIIHSLYVITWWSMATWINMKWKWLRKLNLTLVHALAAPYMLNRQHLEHAKVWWWLTLEDHVVIQVFLDFELAFNIFGRVHWNL